MASNVIESEEVSELHKHKNWEDRVSFLYKKETMADCYFVINEGDEKIRIPSHKFILAAHSKEFFNLFYLLEPNSNEIFVGDFSIEILDKFLEFVYFNNAELTDIAETWEIIKMSRLYGAQSVIDKCTYFLEQKLTDDNVFVTLNKAIVLDYPSIDVICWNFLKKKTVEIFQNLNFLEVDLKTIHKILQFKQLPGKEIEIFGAVNNWIDNNLNLNNKPITSENRRDLLGPAIREIRFGSMTIEEFYKCTEDEKSILSKDEMLKIYNCIASVGIKDCGFSVQKREQYLLPILCRRITGALKTSCCVGTTSYVRFVSSEDILCCGIGLFGKSSRYGKGLFESDKNENVSFSIKKIGDDENDAIFLETTVNIVHDGSDNIINVFLKEDVFIHKNVDYDIRIKREGPCGLYWGGNNPKILVIHNEIEFKFPDLYPCNTDTTTAGILYKKVTI